MGKSASDYTYTDHLRTSYPPGCQLSSNVLRGLEVFGGGSTGSCSPFKQCICKKMPYYMIESAAAALDLPPKIATDGTSYTRSSSPPGCQLRSSSSLYVYGGGNTGSCSSSEQCI